MKNLHSENQTLKQPSKKLEKDLIECQKEMLQLKVDFSGINKSGFKTYDQLRSKIADVIATVCEGATDQIKLETSSNIPIMDCHRLGIYRKNRKRTVKVYFLFMKHKSCLLDRR